MVPKTGKPKGHLRSIRFEQLRILSAVPHAPGPVLRLFPPRPVAEPAAGALAASSGGEGEGAGPLAELGVPAAARVLARLK